MTREDFYEQMTETHMNIPPLTLGRANLPPAYNMILSARTERGADWALFAAAVLDHIESYTVTQYGDTGEDPASNYTPEDALRSASKYIARYGKNVREGEQFRDFLKLAHYAQLAATTWRAKK